MRTIFAGAVLAMATSAGFAQPLPVMEAALEGFDGLPQMVVRAKLGDICGGDARSGRLVRYCTSENRVYVVKTLVDEVGSEEAAFYMLAHAYGHALQVRYGIADVALARIRADRSREAVYRGWVTRQVECFAGVLWSRVHSGEAGPADWFEAEPFTGSHWGSTPVSARAQVSIGLAERDRWFRIGRDSADFALCDVEEFSAQTVARAAR